jgi:ephrin-B
VNKGNIPFEYDQVNIICPVYMPGTHEEDAEKYIIYNVSGSVGTYLSVHA